MINRKWTWESPFFVHCKKHRCPYCNSLLNVKRLEKIVDSHSEEAKDFDFSCAGGDGFMLGSVIFSFEVFVCTSCERDYSIKEIKESERIERRLKQSRK